MTVSKRTRFEVLRRDNYTCRYCRSTESQLHVDHVTPVSLGGTDDPSNLVAACKDCNVGKASSSPDSSTVAQVADDAVRWAAAMQTAYDEDLIDLKKRRAYIRKFEREWGKYVDSMGRKVSMPSTYANTIGHWFTIHVPFEYVAYGIERAMANRKISKGDTFRYTCGIVWKKVEKARESAALAVAEPTTRDVAEVSVPASPEEIPAGPLAPCCDAIRDVAEKRMGLGSMLLTDFIDRRDSRLVRQMRDHDCSLRNTLEVPEEWHWQALEVANG